MSRKKKNNNNSLPSRQALLAYIKESGGVVKKKEIAKAFRIKGDARFHLNQMLREFEKEGLLEGEGRDRRLAGFLPPVTIVEITGLNEDGEAEAIPCNWSDTRKAPPYILVYTENKQPAPAIGQRVLVKLRSSGKNSYLASVLRILPEKAVKKVLGVFQRTKGGGLVEPVNRKQRQDYFIPPEFTADTESGELVLAELLSNGRSRKGSGAPQAKIIDRIGAIDSPRSYSLIAIHHHEIPIEFSDESLEQAESAKTPTLDDRLDLRDYALVTIDGEDARDFDDAVWAQKTDRGWHLLVAIADVAHYVPIDSPLDREALQRGNSTYFPDYVVPMLPEALSNGLCSLRPDEDRYCLAVHLHINNAGELFEYEFVRGLMRSNARLTYEQVQHMKDTGDAPANLTERLDALYGAYSALHSHRETRGALELNLPEYETKIGEDGQVADIRKRTRLDSHRLIEEFMVCANVAAADAIERSGYQGIFRVHEAPAPKKVTELANFLKTLNYSIPKTPQGRHFNKLLEKVADKPEEALVNGSVLRTQMQACYTPRNLGHFGLGLETYCHFTSPIRRYADLVVHRALVAIIEKNKPDMDEERLGSIANHISETERNSMLAEREAKDRYVTAYMASHGEAEFDGSITSIGNYGVFVTLHDNGASGIIRMSDLGKDYYVLDEKHHRLVGKHTGDCFQLGQRVKITVLEADTQLGTLRFQIIGTEKLPTADIAPSRNQKQKHGKKKNSKQKKRLAVRRRKSSSKK